MSLIIIKTFASIIIAISGFYIVKNLTNSKEKILNIADEVILIKNGKIVNIGTSRDIIDKEIINKTCCKLKNNIKEEKSEQPN